MKKKVDSRIRTLIENGVEQRFRSLFVIVGDKGRDQVVNLHYMMSKAVVKSRPSVLWCYKKDLGFTSHRKKRMRQIKKMIARGLMDPDKDDPFELFISSTQIRYAYYSETHKILGNTYGMLVLQDFEALTPNILARTIETVEGGGLVVLLLRTMKSLKQLYTMVMDVHSRFRTESHHDVVGRFNERFLLSLGSCKHCLVLDDELNILPISSHAKSITKYVPPAKEGDETLSGPEKELKDLKISLKETLPIGSLIQTAKTLDQAKAILTFAEAISEKSLRSTVVLTAARGRGKSAALGVAIAGAVAYGYSNIFVTSPSPENLNTLFEFVLKGLDSLEYQEHLDYEMLQSTNPDFNKSIVRMNIFRTHRQTIQYIAPQDADKLAQAELVVIDEAAAIPLPLVQKLLGNFLVFMSSTITGYEGTGRSLSLKLINQLRQQSLSTKSSVSGQAALPTTGRVFREMKLEEPIRYGAGDPIEQWLYDLLCLDATDKVPRLLGGCPHPSMCDLYYVNRDTLFSRHKASEAFLQRMIALYVSSHYKNSPNDLQLMSDAPAHHLFVLLGPINESTPSALPDILVVIQLCLEGEISKQSVMNSLARGARASGDLIPWTLSQQYQDPDFAKLSGGRVVRIATHPDLQKMGYGQRALEQLAAYYKGLLPNLDESDASAENGFAESNPGDEGEDSLLTEAIIPRKNLPPLLQKLSERRPEGLHYLGVSYGLTLQLYNFWKKCGYIPVYVRLTTNDLTGEHSCIMLKDLQRSDLATTVSANWLDAFSQDFKRRVLSLFAYDFRAFSPSLALSIVSPKVQFGSATKDLEEKGGDKDQDTPAGLAVPGDGAEAAGKEPAASTSLTTTQLAEYLTQYDMKRLEMYGRNLVDYHIIVDLLPTLARLYFLQRLPVTLSYGQAAILLSLGLQHKDVTKVTEELNLPSNQVLALFNKAMRKVSNYLRQLQEKAVESSMAKTKDVTLLPTAQGLDEELEEGAAELSEQLKEKRDELLKSISVSQFAIKGTDQEWEATLGKSSNPTMISVKSSNAEPEPKKRKEAPQQAKKHGGKWNKKGRK